MLVVVTGMRREARIFGRDTRVIIAGSDNAVLAARLEEAIGHGGHAVISAGICGGLAPELEAGRAVIATEIVWRDARWPTDAAWRDAMAAGIPGAVSGMIAGSDAILTDAAGKIALRRETGADAVDMESHICAAVAATHGIPFAALRVVSDAAAHALPPAVSRALDTNGNVRIGAILRSVAARPQQVPELLQTARNTRRALAELSRCFDRLGAGFACPHLG
jgi:hopanoid-associated phosphorylase